MNNNIEDFVKDAVKKLFMNTANDIKINDLLSKHVKKIHFIPIRYRIFGGLLQSMNIQFGNFIEKLLHIIVENESNLIIVKPSGKSNVELPLTSKSDRLIDEYITQRQSDIDYSPKHLLISFNTLLTKIFKIEQNKSIKEIKTKHDIDVLFAKNNNELFYLEVKYNDDHDTGKYVDINRKFIKTYIGLCNIKKIYDLKKFKPILYFLTPKIMKGNIYVPEKENIYRGSKLFDEFFKIKYLELDQFMKNIGDNDEIKKLFDDLYNKVRNKIEIN